MTDQNTMTAAELRAQSAREKLEALSQAIAKALESLQPEDRTVALRFTTAVMEQLSIEREAIDLQVRGVRLQKMFFQLREMVNDVHRPELPLPSPPFATPIIPIMPGAAPTGDKT